MSGCESACAEWRRIPRPHRCSRPSSLRARRWIFARYAEGWSVQRIAHELNARKVPSPRASTWVVSAIYGSPNKGSGILNNCLYQGLYIWNRSQWVKDPDTGAVTNWGAEMGPPHGLQRRGWRQNTLKIGEEVTVSGSLAKNGTKRINASKVTLTATGARPGETLDAASSGSAEKVD